MRWPGSGAKHAEALAFRRLSLVSVECDEFDGSRIVLGCDKGGTDLQGIRRSDGMRLHDSFRVTANDLHRRHLGPALPRAEKLPPRREKTS
jgi:hypothetical protein